MNVTPIADTRGDRGTRGLDIIACRGRLDAGEDKRHLIETYGVGVVRAAERWSAS